MQVTEEDINPFAEEESNTSNAGNLESSKDTTSPEGTPRQSTPPPLPTKQSFPKAPPVGHVQKRTEFCCDRDRWLSLEEENEIEIVDAQKTSEGANVTYITYIIRAAGHEARRRYSEFESLRLGLTKLHPTLIIPPIPSKTSLGDYAVKQGKAKEDVAMISRRKRLLHSFLNRLARHPILCHEHVFHRFLQSDVSWSEVLHSPPLSLIPKNILKAPAHSPTDNSAPQIYAALPSPSSGQSLRHPDQRFLDSEAFTEKFASHVSGPLDKVTRRIMKRWSEYAQDHADLGASLNAFSLSEDGPLAATIEKAGQAIDGTYLSTSTMLQDLEGNWAEPLHEYSQFAAIIRKLLQYRHQKHLQFEMTQTSIESKKEQLRELERVEAEAGRLESALSNATRSPPPASMSGGLKSPNGQQSNLSPVSQAEDNQSQDNQSSGDDENRSLEQTPSPDAEIGELPPSYSPPVSKRRTPGMGLINSLSYTIHGMMDVDPEIARRNNITKTRETIAQLQDAIQASAQDVKYASTSIQADLDRFQRQKVADIRDMAIAMAMAHREWCKKNLEAWKEVKKEAENIEGHPNDIAGGATATDQVSPPTPDTR